MHVENILACSSINTTLFLANTLLPAGGYLLNQVYNVFLTHLIQTPR